MHHNNRAEHAPRNLANINGRHGRHAPGRPSIATSAPETADSPSKSRRSMAAKGRKLAFLPQSQPVSEHHSPKIDGILRATKLGSSKSGTNQNGTRGSHGTMHSTAVKVSASARGRKRPPNKPKAQFGDGRFGGAAPSISKSGRDQSVQLVGVRSHVLKTSRAQQTHVVRRARRKQPIDNDDRSFVSGDSFVGWDERDRPR